MAFMTCSSTGKLEEAFRFVFFALLGRGGGEGVMFMKSSILYAVTLHTFVGFETMISPSIEFKKSLDKPTRNVLTATRKKII